MKNILKISLLLIVVFSACKKQEPAFSTLDLKYDYFPLELGTFKEYKIDSIVYDDFTNTIDTFSFFIREEVKEQFLDNAGRETFRIERFIKTNPNSSWIIRSVWTANLLTTRAERNEENLRYVKLIFPPKEGATWNGNEFNILGTQTYTIDYIDQEETIGNIYHEKVLKVIQKDVFNLIRTEKYTEKYALGVGLIERKFTDLETEISGQIKSGSVYSQVLINKGVL
jgi:hypothetical protein